jgi:RNA polymerase sigma-70 factor (ECF subfamily)
MADPRIARARAGDRAAFESLYREHVGRTNALCVRMCGDPVAAEEFVQRAFVRAWEALPGFRGDAGFGTWLHRIAVNEILADRRSHGRSVVRLADDGEVDVRERTPPHPGERVDLEAAIADLPPGARHALVLAEIEGWPHEDVANALGVSVGTVKSQVHRARQLLRERLR